MTARSTDLIRAVADRPYMFNIQGFGLPAPTPIDIGRRSPAFPVTPPCIRARPENDPLLDERIPHRHTSEVHAWLQILREHYRTVSDTGGFDDRGIPVRNTPPCGGGECLLH